MQTKNVIRIESACHHQQPLYVHCCPFPDVRCLNFLVGFIEIHGKQQSDKFTGTSHGFTIICHNLDIFIRVVISIF